MPSQGGLLGDFEAQDVDLTSHDLDIEIPSSNESWQPSWSTAKTPTNSSPWAFSLPSWARPSIKKSTLHKTAYLDGLRGFAALLVYFHHHILWVHNPERLNQNSIFENAFGYDGQYHFAALPGVRLFFVGGHMAVSTFFVLSGYVLSIKPWRLIENDDLAKLAEHLGSAFFRRWFRLYLPIVAVMVVYATSWHAFGLWVDGTSPQGNWLDEMWNLYCDMKNFSFVFKDGGVPWLSYSMHLWSIPVEFRGSMVVFASLLALSRCTPSARLWSQVALLFYFMYISDAWYCAMFISGMLLSHLDLLSTLDRLPRFLARLKPYKTLFCYHMLAVSLYLGGVPCENSDVGQLANNRGWYLLSFFKPQAVFDYKWFYLFWSASLLVVSVSNIGWLRRFFETSVCQYLGRISFALYLVHGPLLWTVGDRFYAAVGFKGPGQVEHIPQWVDRFVLPQTGPLGLELAFLVPNVVLLPVTLCVADMVTRTVDKPSVQLAAWLYGKATLPGAPKKHSQA